MEQRPTFAGKVPWSPLNWWGLLWCGLAMLVALFFRTLLLTKLTLGKFSILLMPATLFDSMLLIPFILPLLLSVLIICMLACGLQKSPVPALLASTLLAFTVPNYDVLNTVFTSATLLGAILFQYFWLGHDNGIRWMYLPLSALFLASSAVFCPGTLLFFLPWLLVLILGERFSKKDDSRLWLVLLVGIGSLAIFLLGAYYLLWTGPISGFFPALLQTFRLDVYFRLPQLQSYLFLLNLPATALLVAGVIMTLCGLIKRRDLSALPLFIWCSITLLLSLFTPLDFVYPAAALILAWMLHRFIARGYLAAAWIVGLIPIFITFITTILTVMEV